MRKRGMLAGMITNGYLLTAERIQRLNRAGLEHMQISIDNVMPDDVSKKSLKVLDKKLQLLSEHADFHVNINSVVGGGIRDPHDALVVGKRAMELGFTSTVGIIHDGDGQLQPLQAAEREVYLAMRSMEKTQLRAGELLPGQYRQRPGEQVALPRRLALSVHLRGRPGALLLAAARISGQAARRIHAWPISAANIVTAKSCAPRCTVACVHQISYIDFWRAPQTIQSPEMAEPDRDSLVQIQ